RGGRHRHARAPRAQHRRGPPPYRRGVRDHPTQQALSPGRGAGARAPLSRAELDARVPLRAGSGQGGTTAVLAAHAGSCEVEDQDRLRRGVHLGTVIARVRELTIHYGSRVAVDGLDLELHAGEIALLLGPNGAGKSTTLSAMAGAVLPSRGAIEVDGQDLATAPRSARAKVGFADQPPALYEFFTVAEHLPFVPQARGRGSA